MAKAFPRGSRIGRIVGAKERERFPTAEFRSLLRLVVANDPSLLSATYHPTTRDGLRGIRNSIHGALARQQERVRQQRRIDRTWDKLAAISKVA